MDEAFEGADVVYPKSWGPYDLMLARVEANRARDAKRMGEIEKEALARNAQHREWICDERRMKTTRGGDALYMHCLPADIGAEVSPGVMAKHVVNVAREANWKVYVVMAPGLPSWRPFTGRFRPRFSGRSSASRPTTSTGREMPAATRAAGSRITRSRASSTSSA
jgi:hypothetical protein